MHTFELFLVAFWAMSLVLSLLNVALTPRLRASARTHGPLVSIIIPARNEAAAIGATVAAMLAQTYRDIELIVIDDRSTDATPQVLASFNDPRLIVLEGSETPDGWLGKPWALEQASRRAAGEFILFVDADVLYAPGAVGALVDAAMADASIALLAVLPRIVTRGFGELASMTALTTVLMGLINPWLVNRTRRPALAMGGGVGNLVRSDAYRARGGHERLRDAVIDDIGLAYQIRSAGHRTAVFLADDLVSVRMYEGLSGVVKGFTKNADAAFGRRSFGVPLIVAYLTAVNILPYGLALAGHRLAILAVALLTAARVAVFAWLRVPLWAAVVLHPVTSAIWIYILLRSAWITRFRGGVHWRGRTARTWSRFGR